MCLGYLLALAEIKVTFPACQPKHMCTVFSACLCLYPHCPLPFHRTTTICVGCLVQVLLAVLARSYHFNPVDPNEPFSNYPVGGEPISGLLMDFKKCDGLK